MNISFSPEHSSNTGGVFSFFLSLSSPNILDFVQTSSNGTHANFPEINILDFSSPTFWASYLSIQDNFISVHFLQHKLKIKNYRIKQYNGEGFIIKTWSFEGSNDGIDWTILDHRSSSDFCNANMIITFPTIHDTFTHFRIRQTGESCRIDSPTEIYLMRLAGLELFGDLIALTYYTHRRCQSDFSSMILTFVSIMLTSSFFHK